MIIIATIEITTTTLTQNMTGKIAAAIIVATITHQGVIIAGSTATSAHTTGAMGSMGAIAMAS
jgi:hypothetical protein